MVATPAEVAAAYREARRRFTRTRLKTKTIKHLRLAITVGQYVLDRCRSGVESAIWRESLDRDDWVGLMAEWNKEADEQSRYTDLRFFKRDCAAAIDKIQSPKLRYATRYP